MGNDVHLFDPGDESEGDVEHERVVPVDGGEEQLVVGEGVSEPFMAPGTLYGQRYVRSWNTAMMDSPPSRGTSS